MMCFKVIVSESSLLGVEGSEGATQRADEDSLSAESLDCVSLGNAPHSIYIRNYKN